MFIATLFGFLFGLKNRFDHQAEVTFAAMTKGMTEEEVAQARTLIREDRRMKWLKFSNWCARIFGIIVGLAVVVPAAMLLYGDGGNFIVLTGSVVPIVIAVMAFAWAARAKMTMQKANRIFAGVGAFLFLNIIVEVIVAISQKLGSPLGAAAWTIVGLITLGIIYACVYAVNAKTESIIAGYGEPKILAIAKAKVDLLRARPKIMFGVIVAFAVIGAFFFVTSNTVTTGTPVAAPTSSPAPVSSENPAPVSETPTDAPTPSQAPVEPKKSSADISPAFYDQLRAEYPEVMGTMSNAGILEGITEVCVETANGETPESIAAGITRPFQFTKQATKEQAMGIVNKSLEMACIYYEPTTTEEGK